MGELVSAGALMLAWSTVYAQALKEPAAASTSSDADFIVWVLFFIGIFFALIGYFTWRLIAGERRRQLNNKPPE